MSQKYYKVAALLLLLCLGLDTAAVHAQTGDKPADYSKYFPSAARDGYLGIISKSDSRKPGQQFTFANLHSSRPFVTYPGGNGDQTTKVFEDDELIVLIFVAHLTGSTETFYLSKKRGQFTLIEVGALEAVATGVDFKPKVTYGTLK